MANRNRTTSKLTIVLAAAALTLAAVSSPLIAGDDYTVVSICSNTPKDDPLPLEGHDITMTVQITHCPPGGSCSTKTVTVTAHDGDTRADLTQKLYDELREAFPGAEIKKSDTSVTIPNTPNDQTGNDGTGDVPKKSPADGNDSDVYSSKATHPL